VSVDKRLQQQKVGMTLRQSTRAARFVLTRKFAAEREKEAFHTSGWQSLCVPLFRKEAARGRVT
jgi:hypothetical protein